MIPGASLEANPRGLNRDRTIFESVVDRLGAAIVTGELPEGTTLAIDQLTSQMGVSRSVMREAFRTLGSLGLIESRQNRGTLVLGRGEWDLLSRRVISWRAMSKGFHAQQRELLELRLGVEPVAASLAATRCSSQQAAAMLAYANEMMHQLTERNPRAFFSADVGFHRVLMEGSDNPVIAQLAETVAAVLEARGDVLAGDARELREASVLRHIALAEAIGQRDPVQAARWAREIVLETLKELEGSS